MKDNFNLGFFMTRIFNPIIYSNNGFSCSVDDIVNDPCIKHILALAAWFGIPVCIKDYYGWVTDGQFSLCLGTITIKIGGGSTVSEVISTLLHELGHGIDRLVNKNSSWKRTQSSDGDIISLVEECTADKIAVYLNQVFSFISKEDMINELGNPLDTYAVDVTEVADYGKIALREMFDTPFSSQLKFSPIIAKLLIDYKCHMRCSYNMLDTIANGPFKDNPHYLSTAKERLAEYKKDIEEGHIYGCILNPEDYPRKYQD